jgi:tetratricopeptide (TPR) repeat protein
MMKWTVRKTVRSNKKPLVATGMALCLGAFPAAGYAETQILFSIYPSFVKPFQAVSDDITFGTGATAKFTVRPVRYVDFFGQVDYLALPYSSNTISVVAGSVGGGYHFALNDRMSLNVAAQIGAYHASSGSSTQKPSGITGGANVSFSYRINPIISADTVGSLSHYASSPKALLTGVGIQPGITLNLTEAFSKNSKVSLETKEVLPVFPVLYSWYEHNKFATVSVLNDEDADIEDVTVSFYQQQYMGQPNVCSKMKKVRKGERFDVDLTAFFNERMLELTEETDTKANVIVEYSYLGQKRRREFAVTIPVYNRNAMSWDDDRRAAVFVSSKDPAALWFAKYITSIVRDNVRSGIASNIQYAMGIFETLDQFGLNYVVDPSSAYADNVGQTSIDFLQFPYQTLMYRGGDCDDLSILVSSLFEAIGIKTAFITIPGHIYMAFDTGLTLEQAQQQFSDLSEFIIKDGKVWMPLEITLTDEGFNKAWRVGAREWNNAQSKGVANFYPMADSWKLYKPVSVPGAAAHFTMPDRKIVAKLFQHRLDEWIEREIGPLISRYEKELARRDKPETRNSLGILYGEYGLFTDAEDQFKKARRTGYIPAILNTANIFFAKQKYDKAMEWYNLVLAQEPQNKYALLGIARCQYELGNYSACDKMYSKLCAVDIELAGQYTYLGSFENTKGRSFSLADRLATMAWCDPSGVSLSTAVAVADDKPTSTPVKTLAQLESEDAADNAVKSTAVSKTENDDSDDSDNDLEFAAAKKAVGGQAAPVSVEQEIAELPGLNSQITLLVPDLPVQSYIEPDVTKADKKNVPAATAVTADEEMTAPVANEIAADENNNVPAANVVASDEEPTVPATNVVASDKKVNVPAANEVVADEEPTVPATNVVASDKKVNVPAANVVVADEKTIAPVANEIVADEKVNVPAANEVASDENNNTPVANEVASDNNNVPAAIAVETNENNNVPAANEVVADEKVDVPAANEVVADEKVDVPAANEIVADEKVNVPAANVVASDEKTIVPVANVVVADENNNVPAANEVAADENNNTPVANEVASDEKVNVPAATAIAADEEMTAPVANEIAADENNNVPAANEVVTDEKVNVPAANVVVADNNNAPAATAVEADENNNVPAANVVASDEKVNVPASNAVAADEEPTVPAANDVASDEKVDVPASNVVVADEINNVPAADEVAADEKVNVPAANEIVADEKVNAPAANVVAADNNNAPAATAVAADEEPTVPAANEVAADEEPTAPAMEETPAQIAPTENALPAAEPVMVETPKAAVDDAPIVNRAVPRFTVQPSSEWAPEVAYQIDTIPGMKSYEEEMGEYQNDKSFLYEDDDSVSNSKNDEKKTAAADTKPDADPFSSYLDPTTIREIKQKQIALANKVNDSSSTNKKATKPAAVKKIDSTESTTQVAVTTAVTDAKDSAGEIIETPTVTEKKTKNNSVLLAIIGAVAAALGGTGAALHHSKKVRKEEKNGEGRKEI